MQKICRRLFVLAPLFSCSILISNAQLVSSRLKEVFKKTDLKSNLFDPWEITYASDGFLWITEAKGYKVIRMNPTTGDTTVVLNLQHDAVNTPALSGLSNTEFNSYKRTFTGNETGFKWPQGGMMGMAFHPEFSTNATKRFVYLAYVRAWVGKRTLTSVSLPLYPDGQGIYFTTYLTRWTYDTALNKLINPITILDNLPGSSDHNSGRMIVAPVGSTNYLFYSVGDMGAGQFESNSRIIRAQTSGNVQGKILRFNLESPWIPADNPDPTSPIFSTGIRNNQGFAYAKFGVADRLFGSSHGPFSDDEINLIENGKNYGHPLVIGYAADGNYNGVKAGAAGGSLPTIALSNGEQDNAANTIGSNYRDPIYSLYDATQARVTEIYQNQTANNLWPSEAPSGIDIYTGSVIPGWKNSLLIASLKWGRILRLKLNATGTGIVPVDGAKDTVTYLESENRYRDIAISPNGKTIYTIMDQGGASSGPSAMDPIVPACPGCVQAFTFLGYAANSAGLSSIPASIPIAAGTDGICETLAPVLINADNTNIWAPITDSYGNIVAEVKANGNAIGTVSAFLYKNGGAVRQDAAGRLYLNRNVSISASGTGPFYLNGGVDLRIYLTTAEYEALRTATNSNGFSSGVASKDELGLFKTNGAECFTAIAGVASPVSVDTVEPFGNYGYVINAKVNSFSAFFVANSSLSVLPIVMKEVQARWLTNVTSLSWNTLSEMNTAGFEIERSLNGSNFTVVGYIPAKGNNNTLSQYRFIDDAVASISSPVFYYRIRVKSMDGKDAYSPVVSLARGGNTFYVKVFPNPVKSTGTLTIFSDRDEKLLCQLTDISGRIIRSQVSSIMKGQNTISIEMNDLPAGIYHLLVKGQHFSQNLKLQKQ